AGGGGGAGRGVPLPTAALGWHLDHELCAAWLVQVALVEDPTDELEAYLTIVTPRILSTYSLWFNGVLKRLTIPWRTIVDDGSRLRTPPEIGGASTVESAFIVLNGDNPVSSLKRALRRLSKNSPWIKVVVWLRVRWSCKEGSAQRMERAYLVDTMNDIIRVAWDANRWRLVVAVPRAEDPDDPIEGVGVEGCRNEERLVGRVDVYGFDRPLDPGCVKQSVSLIRSCSLASLPPPGPGPDPVPANHSRLTFFSPLDRVNLGGCPLRIATVHVPPWVARYNLSGPHPRDPRDPVVRALGPCAEQQGEG
ncbi:Pyranose 2-oxidase, partial [Frankliniella fusca]